MCGGLFDGGVLVRAMRAALGIGVRDWIFGDVAVLQDEAAGLRFGVFWFCRRLNVDGFGGFGCFGVFGGLGLAGVLAAVQTVERADNDENSEGDEEEVDDVLDKVAISDVSSRFGAEEVRYVDSEFREVEAASKEAGNWHDNVIDKGGNDGGKSATNSDTDSKLNDVAAVDKFTKLFEKVTLGELFKYGFVLGLIGSCFLFCHETYYSTFCLRTAHIGDICYVHG